MSIVSSPSNPSAQSFKHVKKTEVFFARQSEHVKQTTIFFTRQSEHVKQTVVFSTLEQPATPIEVMVANKTEVF